ncbi:MAG: hypothetical protein WCB68_19475 [Pyrinomonadaceae bacterium]
MLNRRKGALPSIAAPIMLGIIGLLTLMRRPRFEAFHTVDVLQLLASGMCFGVALVALLSFLRGRPRQ